MGGPEGPLPAQATNAKAHPASSQGAILNPASLSRDFPDRLAYGTRKALLVSGIGCIFLILPIRPNPESGQDRDANLKIGHTRSAPDLVYVQTPVQRKSPAEEEGVIYLSRGGQASRATLSHPPDRHPN